jgi:hypothetical protein
MASPSDASHRFRFYPRSSTVEPAIVNRAIGGSNPSVGVQESAECWVLNGRFLLLSTQHSKLSTDNSV